MEDRGTVWRKRLKEPHEAQRQTQRPATGSGRTLQGGLGASCPESPQSPHGHQAAQESAGQVKLIVGRVSRRTASGARTGTVR